MLSACRSFADVTPCDAATSAAASLSAGTDDAAPPSGYPFGPASVWRTNIGSAAVSPDSRAVVAYLARSVAVNYGGVAAFNVRHYENSLYVADGDTPRVDVAFDDCQDKGYVPAGVKGPGGQFEAVPIPVDAVPSAGTDSTLSIYAPSTDRLWEFWRVERTGTGRWAACWGGRIDHVSRSAGYFLHGFGSSASGLSVTGGTVSLADVRAGVIRHALSLVVTNPAIYNRVSWPAQRSDGWDTDPRAVPEGTRLRLDPKLDVGRLGLSPVAAMIARAAQTYGFIVTDKGGTVAVTAQGGSAEEAASGVDPWSAMLGELPDYLVMKGFPWGHLQVLPQNYGRPATACA